jgi:AcrR family transcriptional regulator
MTRRERLAAERRTKILEAAARIFAERGFHRTTTKDIAEVADVAEGTIYNYFGTKDDLLLALLDQLDEERRHQELYDRAEQEDLRAALENHMRESLVDREQYFTLLEALLPELITNPVLAKRYIDEQFKPSTEILESLFRLHAAAGHLQTDNIDATVRLLYSMFVGLWVLSVLGDEKSQALMRNPEATIHSSLALIFDGLEKREQ